MKRSETPEGGRGVVGEAVAGAQLSGVQACERARLAVRRLGGRGGG